MGHMFCLTDMEQPGYVEVSSTFDKIDELKDKYRSASGPGNRALRNWVHLGFNGDIVPTVSYSHFLIDCFTVHSVWLT